MDYYIVLIIDKYENIIINLDNNYKDLKNRIINTMYDILDNIYYCNLLEINKRKNYQRKIIVKIKMLDYYFGKLYKKKLLKDNQYNDISKRLLILLKLTLGWMK